MIKKITVTLFLTLLINNLIYCQSVDSIKLNEVSVNSYFSNRPLLRLPSSASVIDEKSIGKQAGQSLVPVMNTIPGVRMEERSPGSYRLSLRGSLLRSPFGIRNLKIYLEDFPLTDAGGNTYLNLLDLNTIRSIEILKGPDGSLFGANSGGVVRINTLSSDSVNEVFAGIGAGSYGAFNEYVSVKQQFKNNTFTLSEGWQRSDGYRDNSKLDRKYIQLSDQFRYLKAAKLTLLLFYSRLYYQTPGGLTWQQWTDAPSSSRPPTPFVRGAKEQQAAIYNSTFYTGIANEIKINRYWSHVAALFGSYTDFENPFITNYEIRRENTLGARTWFQASNNQEGDILVKFHVGLEVARTYSNIKNYDNNFGQTGLSQKFDKLYANQSFIFNHLMFDFYNKWILDGGLSINFNRYSFQTTLPTETPLDAKIFTPQVMPKAGISYQASPLFAFRASVSKGYSTPTLSEIRSSDNQINTALQPENGWNYEAGLRFRSANNFIWWDLTCFYYKLSSAIVRRVNEMGQEYFINAGGTKQTGMESQLQLQLISERSTHFIRKIQIDNSLTYSIFKFDNYSMDSINYSENKMTGVPAFIGISGLTIGFPQQIYLFIQHNYTSSIFLNDANTVSADPYHLLLLKAGWKFINKPHVKVEVAAGVDNLLNEKYSLGNDLNAVGGRYFNAAMPRNYFCKLLMKWH